MAKVKKAAAIKEFTVLIGKGLAGHATIRISRGIVNELGQKIEMFSTKGLFLGLRGSTDGIKPAYKSREDGFVFSMHVPHILSGNWPSFGTEKVKAFLDKDGSIRVSEPRYDRVPRRKVRSFEPVTISKVTRQVSGDDGTSAVRGAVQLLNGLVQAKKASLRLSKGLLVVRMETTIK